MSFDSDANAVIATVESAALRFQFLPTHFGQHMILGEALVYGWLDRISNDYTGGPWEFFSLSNGGFYMAPVTDKPFKIEVATNYFSGEMSADAAGVVATLFALCDLANRFGEARLIDRYHWLRDFAIEHAEASLIMGAID
jgi:Antirestriction protein